MTDDAPPTLADLLRESRFATGVHVNRKAAEQIAAVFDLGAHRSRNGQAGTAPDERGRTGKEAV